MADLTQFLSSVHMRSLPGRGVALLPVFSLLTDGNASLSSVITAGFSHRVVDIARRYPNELLAARSFLLASLMRYYPTL